MDKFKKGDLVYHKNRNLFATVSHIELEGINAGLIACVPDSEDGHSDYVSKMGRKWRKYKSDYLIILPENTPQAKLAFLLKYNKFNQ